MNRVTGHGRQKYLTGALQETSAESGWVGMLAERWRHSEGDLGSVEPHDTEIVVMLQGRGRVQRRGEGRIQVHEAVPGMVWLCPAGIREDKIRVWGDHREMLHLYLPSASLATNLLRESDVDFDKSNLRYDGGFHDPLIEQIARSVSSEMAEPGPGGLMLVEVLAAALGIHVMRHYSNLSPASVTMPKARGALDSRRLRRAQDFIKENLYKRLSIESLANEVNLSLYHFARAFKASTGESPHRYITRLRVEQAKTLISRLPISLAEVSEQCGFSSQAHFTRWFKRIVGATPGVYRADCR